MPSLLPFFSPFIISVFCTQCVLITKQKIKWVFQPKMVVGGCPKIIGPSIIKCHFNLSTMQTKIFSKSMKWGLSGRSYPPWPCGQSAAVNSLLPLCLCPPDHLAFHWVRHPVPDPDSSCSSFLMAHWLLGELHLALTG